MTRQEKIDCAARLLSEIDRSMVKHGDWADYDRGKICKAVSEEYQEFICAYIADDVTGQHGQALELLQLACVALKGFYRLGGLDVSYNHLQDLSFFDAPQGIAADPFPGRCGYCLQPVPHQLSDGDAAAQAGMGD